MIKFYLFLLLVVVTPCLGQDLVITNVTGPTAVDKYAEIKLSITIKNTGIVPIQGNSVSGAAYLSADGVIDASDFPLTDFYIPGLAPNESKVIDYVDQRSLTVRIVINGGFTIVNPGSYNLIFKADNTARIIETDETNNTFIIPEFTVREPNVNLKFNRFSLSSYSVSIHSGVTAIFEASNTGTTDLSWFVGYSFYLSNDQAFSDDDIFINAAQSRLLTGTDVFTNIVSDDKLVIPNVTQGQYYIIANVDDYDGRTVFVETNETDNFIVSDPVTISPSNIDISPTRLSVFSIDHDYISGDLTIKNFGTTHVEEFSIDAYLSTSPYYNDYAVILPTDFRGVAIAGNDEKTIHFYFPLYWISDRTIPYTLFFNINPSNNVKETNYTNNSISYGYIGIPNPPIPRWTITNMTLADSYDNTDKVFDLSVNFLNSGTAHYSTEYYKVVIKDAANNIKHTAQQQQFLSSYPQTQVTKNLTFTLNAALPVGQYTIEISCATAGGCNINTYSIPLTINQVQYALSGNIQGEDGVPITKGKLFLYQQRVNGLVEFINKVVPTTSDVFNFQLDEKAHTLFFIPDKTDFPDYAPTIYGKTVTLKPSSFFTLTGNDDLTFEILKVTPGLAGNKTIAGTVANEAAARGRFMTAQTASTEVLPVILLSETGEVLAVTETDANGAYQFANLAPGKYQVIVAFELDQFIVPEPTPVDVTVQSATLDFNYGGNGVGSNYQPVLEDQTIEFPVLTEKTFGDASFELTAYATSALEVTFTSSNPAVAQVQNNVVTIVGAGTTTITAYQNGNSLFHPASEREQLLVVQKANQSITFSELGNKKTTDAEFQLTASSSADLNVSFSSDNERVATIEGNVVTIKGAGQANITATQNGNQNFNAASVTRVLIVSLANQTISFNALPNKKFGDVPFTLAANTTSGLPVSYHSSNPAVANVNGNVVTILSAGETEIKALQNGNAVFAAAEAVTHTLTVLKAEQEIIFEELPQVKMTDADFQLVASATSGLPVSFVSDNEQVASVQDNKLVILGAGEASITAIQAGNQNYTSAIPITRILQVEFVTALEPWSDLVRITPNPTTTGELFIDTRQPIQEMYLLDLFGRKIKPDAMTDTFIDISEAVPGIYLLYLKLQGSEKQLIRRIVRR
jgi:Ethanolamine utilization protein EutJ (predicted chaperonin)